MIVEGGLIGFVVALFRNLLGYINANQAKKQPIDIKKTVSTVIINSAAAAVTGATVLANTGSVETAIVAATVAGALSSDAVKAVTTAVKLKTSEERSREIFKALYGKYISTQHSFSAKWNKLAKEGIIDPLPYLAGKPRPSKEDIRTGLSTTVNAVHKNYAGLLPDIDSAIILTWEKARALMEKNTLFAEAYFYEALSYSAIPKDKQTIAEFKATGKLSELFRQLVYMDRDENNEFIKKNQITGQEIENFLLHLASDNLQIQLTKDEEYGYAREKQK